VHRLKWISVTLLLCSCSWTRPAREDLLTLATDYRVSSTNPHGMIIDYDPADISGDALAPIAEKEAGKYGKTARAGALMVSHTPRVNQQFFEFVDH
jgi:hypothetical protein